MCEWGSSVDGGREPLPKIWRVAWAVCFLQNTVWMTPFVEIKISYLNSYSENCCFFRHFSRRYSTQPYWINPAERRLSTCSAYPNPKHVFFFFVPCLTRLPHSVRSHNIRSVFRIFQERRIPKFLRSGKHKKINKTYCFSFPFSLFPIYIWCQIPLCFVKKDGLMPFLAITNDPHVFNVQGGSLNAIRILWRHRSSMVSSSTDFFHHITAFAVPSLAFWLDPSMSRGSEMYILSQANITFHPGEWCWFKHNPPPK